MSAMTNRPQAPTTLARTALPSVARLALRRTRTELLMFLREPSLVVFSFAYPLVMMLIFSSVFSGEIDGPPGVQVSFAQYFLPGMVATGVMLSSFQTVALQLAQLRDTGGLKRLHGSPLPPVSYFAGVVGQVLVSVVVQVAALLVVSHLAFDVSFPPTPGRWVTLVWIVLLGTATGTLLGIAFSSVPRSGRSATGAVVPIVLVLQFISGVFFQFSSLPSWMQNLSAIFPLKWMAQGLRSVFLPDAMAAAEQAGTWELGKVALIVGVWGIAGAVVAVRTFRWTRRDDG